ncbi:MAG: hypothetical protein U0795_20010 [Pirellulales bacterium]
MSGVLEILSDCSAHGIRLLLASDGSLTIDAADDALTPERLNRLRAHKEDLTRCVVAATVLGRLRQAGLNVIPDDQRPGTVILAGDWLAAAAELVELCEQNWPAIKELVLLGR